MPSTEQELTGTIVLVALTGTKSAEVLKKLQQEPPSNARFGAFHSWTFISLRGGQRVSVNAGEVAYGRVGSCRVTLLQINEEYRWNLRGLMDANRMSRFVTLVDLTETPRSKTWGVLPVDRLNDAHQWVRGSESFFVRTKPYVKRGSASMSNSRLNTRSVANNLLAALTRPHCGHHTGRGRSATATKSRRKRRSRVGMFTGGQGDLCCGPTNSMPDPA